LKVKLTICAALLTATPLLGACDPGNENGTGIRSETNQLSSCEPARETKGRGTTHATPDTASSEAKIRSDHKFKITTSPSGTPQRLLALAADGSMTAENRKVEGQPHLTLLDLQEKAESELAKSGKSQLSLRFISPSKIRTQLNLPETHVLPAQLPYVVWLQNDTSDVLGTEVIWQDYGGNISIIPGTLYPGQLSPFFLGGTGGCTSVAGYLVKFYLNGDLVAMTRVIPRNSLDDGDPCVDGIGIGPG
jgi:hypothetical protein